MMINFVVYVLTDTSLCVVIKPTCAVQNVLVMQVKYLLPSDYYFMQVWLFNV